MSAVKNVLGLAALGVLGLAVVSAKDAAPTSSPSKPSYSSFLRCVGVIRSDQDETAWSIDLHYRAKRLGISTNQLETLTLAKAESENPGVLRRCGR